ncbi:MAG: FecR family protein [Candidatus Omnitrophica bacterium]|nr:FecR family protein [Candidatus Omnitrophota bacterium]
MKKILVIAGCIIFCLLAALMIRKALPPAEEIVYDQANKVFMVKGDVKIRRAENPSSLQDMKVSAILKKGDILETSKDSAVEIVIGENVDKAIKLGENSRLEFQDINPAHLNLSRGKVRVTLKKLEPKSSFTVKTPTAISGARATAWSAEVIGNKTKICVFESDVLVRGIDAAGKPNTKKYITGEGTELEVERGKPVSAAKKISEIDMQDWQYWDKNISFLREGKILVDDFSKKENFNNLSGPLGSWNVFYSDPNQQCKDEFTDLERVGDSGYGLKLTYDVDSPFSAYNGFFTSLMGIDLTDYRYLVFSIKGDKKAGFTTTLNIELKNKNQIGRMSIDGITDEWEKITVPLGQFVGINDFKDMKEFVIVFSDINATKKEGVVYIDDIYFAKPEAPGQ